MLTKTLAFVGTIVALIGISFMAIAGVQDNLYRINTVPAAQTGLAMVGIGVALLVAALITEKLSEHRY